MFFNLTWQRDVSELSDRVIDSPHEDGEQRLRGSVQLPLRVLHLEPFRLRRAQTFRHGAHLQTVQSWDKKDCVSVKSF